MADTYLNAINQEIGEIIKTVQYIEWNLLNQMNLDTFAEMTLGQIINQIKNRTNLDNTAIVKLENILDKRNDLVHKYFKRKDFEKHCNNVPFLDNELRYLQNFSSQVNNFNDWLVKQ